MCSLASHCVAMGHPCTSHRIHKRSLTRSRTVRTFTLGGQHLTTRESCQFFLMDDTTWQKWYGLGMLEVCNYLYHILSLKFQPSTNMMWNIVKHCESISLYSITTALLLGWAVAMPWFDGKDFEANKWRCLHSPDFVPWHWSDQLAFWEHVDWCGDFPKIGRCVLLYTMIYI